MATVAELINDLAVKAGVPVDDAALKAIVTSGDALKVNVPDDLMGKIQGGLHTLESAKSVLKPQIKSEIIAETYNGVDAELYGIAKEHGLDDVGIEELKKLDKTSTRLKTVATKIKELTSKASGSSGKEKQELIDQINALKASQSEIAKQHQAAIDQVKLEANADITTAFVNSHLASYNYANDTLPKGVNVATANVLLQARLSELGAVIQYDKQTGKLKAVKQDGSDLYDAKNNKLTFETLSDQLVADNKLIKASGSGAGNGTQGNGTSGGDATVQTGLRGDRFGTSDLDAMIAEARKSYSK